MLSGSMKVEVLWIQLSSTQIRESSYQVILCQGHVFDERPEIRERPIQCCNVIVITFLHEHCMLTSACKFKFASYGWAKALSEMSLKMIYGKWDNGSKLAGDQHGNIRVWDLTANACSCELVPEVGTPVRSLTVAQDASLVIAANNQGRGYK